MATRKVVKPATPQKKALTVGSASAAQSGGQVAAQSDFQLASQSEFQLASQNIFKFSDFILVKDNTDFTSRFLPPIPPKIVFSKTVVIGQDPPAGNVVPAGTAISLTLAQKHIIPITSFNVNPKIRDTYSNKTLGDLLTDVSSNSTAQLILNQNKPYDNLNLNETGPINALMESKFGLSPTDPSFSTQAKSIYGDLLFLNNA